MASAQTSTRERILDVALDLFEHQGYAGTSLRDIADRLGLTKAAVYYHFPSKEDLLDQALAPALGRVRDVLAQGRSRADLVGELVNVVAGVGPQVVVALSDPTIASYLNGRSDGQPLPSRVAEALARPLPSDPAAAEQARIRASCAVAALQAGVHAWRELHPGAVTLDADAQQLLTRILLTILDPDVYAGPAQENGAG